MEETNSSVQTNSAVENTLKLFFLKITGFDTLRMDPAAIVAAKMSR